MAIQCSLRETAPTINTINSDRVVRIIIVKLLRPGGIDHLRFAQAGSDGLLKGYTVILKNTMHELLENKRAVKSYLV